MSDTWIPVALTAIVNAGQARCLAPMSDYARSELENGGGDVNDWWCLLEGDVDIPDQDGMCVVIGRTTWWDRDEWPDGDAGASSDIIWLRMDGDLDVAPLLELMDRSDRFEGGAMEATHLKELAESRVAGLEAAND